MKLKIVASKLTVYTCGGKLYVVLQPSPIIPEMAEDALVVHIGNGYIELPEKATNIEWRFDDAGEAFQAGPKDLETSADQTAEPQMY
ncbi:MAG: hypothetical protein QXW98_04315 [Candidatus Caldarchaeum sp.]